MDIERPTVKGGRGRTRTGRGFSQNELEKAGWEADEAFAAGIAVDYRRKSCHDQNVEKLKGLKADEE